MTERKFTDEEVIKALEHYKGFRLYPFSNHEKKDDIILVDDALDLINRQRTEIEGLKGVIAAYEDAARESHKEHVKQQAIIDEILTILRGGQSNDPPSMPAGLPSEIG